MKRLGLDIGSAYMGTVLLENDQVVSTTYTEHGGDVHCALKEILDSKTARSCNTVGITGVLAGEFGLTLDSTLCVIEGARFLAPDSRNIFSLGAQHFMLCLYGEGGAYKEHSTNPPCASGTGSFIEQQARRLNLSVPELCNRALAYKGEVPGIATRCAVFAKSDIIHAMQEGYSLDAVCAGLCEGITRTIAESLLKGRTLHAPVAVVGGMSLNRKIMLELERLMGIPVTVPRYGMVCGAVGAALLGQSGAQGYTGLFTEGTRRIRLRKPLELRLSPYPDFNRQRFEIKDGVEILSPAENPDGPAGGNTAREAGGGFAQAAAGNDVIRKPGSQAEYRGLYLGLDIGSTSTKAVLIDRGKRLVKGFYTRTGGRPVDAVLLLVRLMRDYLNRSPYVLAGAAATGSGRKMIKTLFGADLEINEITAHALAAVALYPQVDTIIEIGGQDSKFTLLWDGLVYYSHMNYVCAAGTGSFIEEQARLLNLDLEDFSTAALGSRAPHTSDRCTVYMERDLAELRGRGFSRDALAAAVLFSVRDNYLAKVVNKSPLGEHIVFQGATARNKALVAAFEQIAGKPIHVSPYCHLTGALGAALYCAEQNLQKSGFVFEPGRIRIQDETCSLCSNKCLLKVARFDSNISAWGMKCGREYTDRKPGSTAPHNTPESRFLAALSADMSPERDVQDGRTAAGLRDERPAPHPANEEQAALVPGGPPVQDFRRGRPAERKTKRRPAGCLV
jgi:predicted CoA-substrate-specific enzyme activase